MSSVIYTGLKVRIGDVDISKQVRQFNVSRDSIPVDTFGGEPDPNWTHQDSVGHQHYAVREEDGPYGDVRCSYPTLERRTRRHRVFEWDEFDEDDEGYWDEWTESFYVCPMCGEEITPRIRSRSGPLFIPGPVSRSIQFFSKTMFPVGPDAELPVLEIHYRDGRVERYKMAVIGTRTTVGGVIEYDAQLFPIPEDSDS